MRTRRIFFALSVFALSSGAQTDWPTFGHDSGSNRYSQLSRSLQPTSVKLTRVDLSYESRSGERSQFAESYSSAPQTTAGSAPFGAKTGKERWVVRLKPALMLYRGQGWKAICSDRATGGSRLFDPTRSYSLIAFALP